MELFITDQSTTVCRNVKQPVDNKRQNEKPHISAHY